jgi:hypothetical protein
MATPAPDSNLCAVVKTLALAFARNTHNDEKGLPRVIEGLVAAQNRGKCTPPGPSAQLG